MPVTCCVVIGVLSIVSVNTALVSGGGGGGEGSGSVTGAKAVVKALRVKSTAPALPPPIKEEASAEMSSCS